MIYEVRRSGGEPATQPTATPTATLADTARAFGLIRGSRENLEDLMIALRERLEAIRDPLSRGALAELQRQMIVMDQLFQRFAAEAATAKTTSVNRTLLLRAALQAQQGYARTFVLLHTLAAQTKVNAAPTIELHDDDEPPDH